ncbi:gephyrin-like [Tigriopus californicus]|uniref:gephyrin-like n=1 Tax=Tigriopus californicus TaxID=6832 RepID=UPI0027D9D101|nr:gephyrin-like [Tigriopus californicus]
MPKVGILTVSDSVSQGQSVDRSGPILKDLVQDNADWTVMEQKCLPDENDQIQACLLAWSSPPLGLDLILTTGGTGFGPRDVTPEATEAILEKKAPGLVHRMMSQSLEVTPMAMLSRLSAGSRGQSLIINFPGSPKACRQCFRFVLPALGHAMDLLSGRIDQVRQLHGQMHGLATVSGCGHACAKPANGPPESTGVVGRPRKSPYPMIEVSQAQALVMANCAVLEVVESDFMDPMAHVLAEDIRAVDALPPFRASIKDGYAVVASDGKGKRKVIGGITAGAQEEASISPGRCMRINTGAPIPKGADAVVQVEDTLLSQASADGEEELEIEILTMPQIGQDIRPIGSDIQSGSTVLNKYAVLSAAERGLLATVGVTRVQTFRNPVVSLLSTGNELQDPSDRQPLKPGFIRDSNKSTLTALLREHRFECFDAGIAIDDPEVLEAKLKLALEHGDIVVTTGSVSMGDRDILRQVLVSKFGAQIHFARVNMKPGKPTTFATLEYLGKTKRVLGLPGNPVSATVTAQLYLLPACRQMAGYLNPVPATVRAQLSQDLPLDPRPEYHRAVIRWDRGQAVAMASTTGNQISSRLLSLHAANALLMFPMRSEERNTLKAGEEVDALIIGQLIA